MAKETFNYGKLIAGETAYIIKVPVAAGTYKIGDVLELVVSNTVTAGETPKFSQSVAATYKKATTDAVIGNYYAVCNEDVTAKANDEVVCIKEGYFNKNVIQINDKPITANSIKVLQTKNIFVTDVK